MEPPPHWGFNSDPVSLALVPSQCTRSTIRKSVAGDPRPTGLPGIPRHSRGSRALAGAARETELAGRAPPPPRTKRRTDHEGPILSDGRLASIKWEADVASPPDALEARLRSMPLTDRLRNAANGKFTVSHLERSYFAIFLTVYHMLAVFTAVLVCFAVATTLLLAWFVEWFQWQLRVHWSTEPGTLGTLDVSDLLVFVGVVLRAALYVRLCGELIRTAVWMLYDLLYADSFQLYRAALIGGAVTPLEKGDAWLSRVLGAERQPHVIEVYGANDKDCDCQINGKYFIRCNFAGTAVYAHTSSQAIVRFKDGAWSVQDQADMSDWLYQAPPGHRLHPPMGDWAHKNPECGEYISVKTKFAKGEEEVAEILSIPGNLQHYHQSHVWADFAAQVFIYGSLDIVPIAYAVHSFLSGSNVPNAFSELMLLGSGMAAANVVVFHAAWTVNDVMAKIRAFQSLRESWSKKSPRHSSFLSSPFCELQTPAKLAEDLGKRRDAVNVCVVACALISGTEGSQRSRGILLVVLLLVASCLGGFAGCALVLGIVSFWNCRVPVPRSVHSVVPEHLPRLGAIAECWKQAWARLAGGPTNGDTREWAMDMQKFCDHHLGLSPDASHWQYDLMSALYLSVCLLFLTLRGFDMRVPVSGMLALATIVRRMAAGSFDPWSWTVGVSEGLCYVALAVILQQSWWYRFIVLLLAVLLQFTFRRHQSYAVRPFVMATWALQTAMIAIVAVSIVVVLFGERDEERAEGTVTRSTVPEELLLQADVDGSSLPETYDFCGWRWPLGMALPGGSLQLMDFARFCSLSTWNAGSYERGLRRWFPEWRLAFSRRAEETPEALTSKDWASFFQLDHKLTDTTVFVVRGTKIALEVLQDLNIWMPVAVAQAMAVFGPDVIRPTVLISDYLMRSDQYYIQLLDHVNRTVMENPTRRYYITGHSLGGGLANIVSMKLGIRAVTISSPGVKYAGLVHVPEISDLEKRGSGLSFVVVPEYDLVPRVDAQVGSELRISCSTNTDSRVPGFLRRTGLSALLCHKLQTTLDELARASCLQAETVSGQH